MLLGNKRIVAGRVGRGDANSEGGFTLVELAIAIAVLFVAVLTAISSELSALNVVRTSQEADVAMADLQSAMEQVLLLPCASIPDPSGPFAPGRSIREFENRHLNKELIVPSYPGYTPGAPVPDPLVIVLEARWKDRLGRYRQLRLTTMKTR